ncbi:MAG: hypothetical protein IPO63_08480 [Bacteroidetes bacterium]|nr:hypothetical protein [Bacteroidota bacterium]
MTELEKEDQIKNVSARLMFGDWHSEWENEGKKHVVSVRITPYGTSIPSTYSLTIDGIKIDDDKFFNTGHWFGPWLMFENDKLRFFYMEMATELEMIFGESINEHVGISKWKLKMQRVQALGD